MTSYECTQLALKESEIHRLNVRTHVSNFFKEPDVKSALLALELKLDGKQKVRTAQGDIYTLGSLDEQIEMNVPLFEFGENPQLFGKKWKSKKLTRIPVAFFYLDTNTGTMKLYGSHSLGVEYE